MKKITRRRFLKLGGLAGLTGLFSAYPVFIERNIVLANTYTIPVPNLSKDFSGLRMIQITDLHHGPLVSLPFIQKVVTRVNRLSPDIIVLTGDFVHGKNSTARIDSVWPVLSELSAPYGVFAVLGNHDHWADTDRCLLWMDKVGCNLRKKSICLERNGSRLWLVGAGDLWEDHFPLDDLLKGIPEDECRIVLAHNPDTADTPFTSRVDLMVSGHTHGGQVRVPFAGAPVLPVKNKNYSSGLKTSPRGMKVFISRGIGWAIYPVRFNCYPEISVLELCRG